MSWASRRRTYYLGGVILIVLIALAIPVMRFLNRPPTCTDGIRNQGETAPDIGGPCVALSGAALQSQAVLWVRPFLIRAGEYSATAYVDNPNKDAAVISAPYKFSFYDADNILIAEREGTTPIMPGAITPVYASQIDSGSRVVARAFFEFTAPLSWVRAPDPAAALTVGNIRPSATAASSKVSADVTNTGVTDIADITYTATLFDTAGNAFASSQTLIQELPAGITKTIVFAWPAPFASAPARVDVVPTMMPVAK